MQVAWPPTRPIRWVTEIGNVPARPCCSLLDTGRYLRIVFAVQHSLLLSILLIAAFALSRWPGLLPENFSAAYALAFCAGVFFSRKMAWWLPLTVLAATDLALNCYYQFVLGYDCFTLEMLLYMLGNYAGYVMLIMLGRSFKPQTSLPGLIGGGIFGALLFYLITNTLSWLINPFNNPEYMSKTIGSWIWALTKGTGGWPETWNFFRNTLLSGGLFTGLFALAMKLGEPAEEEESETEESPEEDAEPAPAGEAKA